MNIKVTKDYVDFGGFVMFFEEMRKLPETKENAIYHMIDMFCQSWTFAKMTDDEKSRCMESFMWAKEQKLLTGDYHQRRRQCYAIYNAYLAALGYVGGGANWRKDWGNES